MWKIVSDIHFIWFGSISDINKLWFIPVMAAIAVRKKVISIGDFSPCFLLQSLQFFFICEINSRAIVCIKCTENQRKIGLSQMSSMS